MGQAKKEISGKVKRLAGAVTGNEDLTAKGEAEDREALEEDQVEQAGQKGLLTDSDGQRPYAWDNNRSRPDGDE